MLEIGWFSAKLFLTGRLLRDPVYFVRQTSIGISICFLIFAALAQANISLWVPITVSSLITGAIMPFLFKDLKLK